MKRIILLSILFFLSACSMMPDQNTGTKNSITLLEESKEYVLENNSVFQMSATPVQNNIAQRSIEMFAYNAQIPGPLLHVKQGSTIWVNFTNNLNTPTTIHWHGLRLENQYDGVPMLTQNEIEPTETFFYKLIFPDAGIYWYHPHIREDYQQELGLYGNILVDPAEEDYYNPVTQEEVIVLDDILLTKEGIELFEEDVITYALMGRFGNILLVNGKTEYNFSINKGAVVRFFITNAANSRVFNFSIENTMMKLVGSDSGAYEQEQFVDAITIAPAERYIVEVWFPEEGPYSLINANPYKKYSLGTVQVREFETTENTAFNQTKENSFATEELEAFKVFVEKSPDITLELEALFAGMQHVGMMDMNEGIEWEDTMVVMNREVTNETIQWIIKDTGTGKKNEEIAYHWKVGDKIKIRIYNKEDTTHPMQHPIHLHGQRFVIVAANGIPNNNLVWKDTVLVPVGSYVDIIVDVTNPGEWMTHCHIAEHLQSGMMFTYVVY